jgi:hypothetical protein
MGAEKIQGRGHWKHNNALLKEDKYCRLMEDTFIEARRTRCSDNPAQNWDWIKQRAKEVSVNFSKRRSKEKREDRARLEHDYARELKKPKPDITEHRAMLQKHFQEEDNVIHFRTNLDELEHDEESHPSSSKRSCQTDRRASHVSCHMYKNIQIPQRNRETRGDNGRSRVPLIGHLHRKARPTKARGRMV